MVGRAPALLAAALFAVLVVYYETSTSLWHWGLWGDVAWLACVLIPAVFLLDLLVLPLRLLRPATLLWFGLGLLAVVVVLHFTDWRVTENFAKFGAETFLGWFFLTFFESLSWVVLVAAIIPVVDSLSVWRGPTREITHNHPQVFDVVSFAFPVPGERAAAQLGPPDVLFFALFLAAAARFRLRVGWTFVGMVAGLGLTIAATTEFQALGLPALPGVALGFLVPNLDLIWRGLRPQPGLGESPDVPLG